ncbi:MAG: ThiF family adenylyltransferase [Bacteroidaceae bacterium]|nr:ThiF family adenylyltransferase [Bacteroidaceae bacterium]
MEELPIIYIDKEELKEFCSQDLSEKEGISYEWEKEQVVHIKLNPSLHSFGRIGKVAFQRGDFPFPYGQSVPWIKDEFSYIVYVLDENTARVFEVVEGRLIEKKLYYIPSKDDLYSRSKGILEVNILESKRVMIVGLGSFGSQIAIELAKAGVGSFSLFDFDRIELHNLARHTCTIKDLGRLKTDAIYDAIVGKNPYAHVDKFPIDINKNIPLLNEEISKADIVICATDNNKSRFNISEELVKQQKLGIFGRAVTRAEGGDIFRYVPGGPCYCCLIGTEWYDTSAEEITNIGSGRRNGQIPAYVSDEDADAVVQVGLSSDIEPICNLMVKLTLMELSRGEDSGISCLEDELVYDYYMWANRRERRHVNWAPLPNAGNRPTILRWYGAYIKKVEDCPLCSHHIVLDEGEEYEAKLGEMTDMKDVD